MGETHPSTRFGGRNPAEIKDSIELVLEASKKAIPDNIEKLCTHENSMRNFLDMHERSAFAPKGSAEDKHLKAWLENMQRTGAERLFPNITTTASVNESMRILLRVRYQAHIVSGVGSRPGSLPDLQWSWSREW